MRSQREDHHQQSTLGKAVDAIGGAALFGVKTAGVAYGAYRLGRGIGAGRILDYAADGSRKLNSALEATSGVVEGFMRTIDSAGWKETFTGRATNELRENLTSSLRKWGNGQRGVIGGEMLRTERLGLDLRKMLDYSAEEAENVVRRQKILDKVAKTPGYNPEIANVVESLVSPGSSAFQAGYRIQQPGRSASDVSREAFDRTVRSQNLRKKFNGSEQDVLNQTLNNLRQVMSDTAERKDFVAQYGNEINTGTKKLQAQFVEAMLSNANKTYGGNEHQGFFAKVLAKAGPNATVRRATYRDLYTHAENPLDLRKVERTGQSSRAFFESLRDRISEIDPRLASRMDNMVVDPNLYIGGSKDRLIDMRGLVRGADRLTETLGREIQVPFVGIRPLSLMRPFVPKDPNEYVSHIFNPGSVINTGKTFAAQSRRTAYYAGQMLNLDYKDGQLAVDVTKDVYLTRFGAHRRALMNMDPTSRYSSTFDELAHDPRLRGRFRNVFDLGMNESRGFVGNVLSIATKFSDPTWTRNMVSGLENGSLLYHTTGYLQGARAKSVRILEQKAGTLTRNQLMEAQDLITKRFGQDFFNALTTGSTEQSTMNAIESLVQMKDAASLVGKDQVRQLERYLAQYKANPDIFSHIKNAHEELNESVLDNLGNAINLRASTPVRYGDKYRQDLQASILHAILPDTQRSTIASVFKGATDGDITDIIDLSLYGRFSSWGDDTESLRQMAGFISGKNYLGQQNILDQDARARFIKIADHVEPVFGFGPQPKPSSVVGAETPVLIRKSNVGDTLIRGINDNILNGSFDLKDPLSMFGPIGKVAGQTLNQLYRESGFGGAGRAGRGNLDQVTEVTTAFYNTFNRLNEYLQAASFGLSKRHTGSAQDLALNLVGRRYILPAMMLGYMAYGNDLIGNITGTEPTDAAVQGYAGISLGVQKVKDVTGLNSFGRWMERLTPGSEQLWGSPMLSPLKWASFGLLGDNRGYEELYDYYTTGNEPVRRGRWWEFGSNTPWTGGRVMGFRPSFYRRALGEPTMTDSLWGSENEYWANNALPTLHNPLGPIKTWMLTPYYWEKKHRYDQPTPVYGGIPELQALPVIGPALDSTVGRVFKPIRTNWRYFKDHRQYIKEINEAIKTDEEQRSRGSILYGTAGGRMSFKGVPDELDMEVEIGPNGEVLGGSSNYGVAGLPAGAGLSPLYMPLASGRGAATTADTLKGINLGLTDVKNLRGLGSRNLNDLVQSNLLDRIDSVSSPYNLLFQGNETMYQVRELMGLRGFALGQLFGEDFGKPDMVLQSSSRAYGYERRFWDQQMGGLGGDFSEAMRRFLPHRQRDVQEYNPMQNNMPDWLPSNLDYFQDFQHGNPYLAVPFGESMLPGEGYESINELHPDAYFGRYGAIDRMRILANAAPWSEQYKYYSRVVSQMHAKGLYTEDEYRLAQRARDEARLKKQKYRFYGYKFKDNEIDRDTVTIDRMIDPFTFTTVERPGEVFRLAGISGLKSPNTEAGAEVNALASQYLQAGQQVTVGVSRDPVGRVRRDTLGTTRAVVWSNGVKVNKALLDAKGVKADYDSTDPASIHALYNPLERTIGSAWESIAHLDNPINNKFLQVRSPLEMYERNFVYGKEFQSWDHPISDWLVPTINKMSKNNPLVATGTGALLGSMFVKSKHGKVIGAAVGGTVGLAGTGGRVLNEAIGRIADPLYTWIPAEERRIREVEEYFDMLKYVKFKGLYERAARAAYKYEGLDVDRLLDQMENGTAGNKSEVRRLQKIKRMIKLSMGDTVVSQEDAKARLEAINQRLNELTGLKEGIMLGPIATQAIQYKQQYEQTLAGADPNGDLANILAALPKRDRAFFQEFMNAKPEEREKILRLVPKNQRRFYQAKWGMKVDRQQNPLGYFLTHNLPGASWHGWEPDADLDEIKLKFINQEGMDLDRFGAWESEMSQVDENTPELSHMGGFILDTFKLKDVLEGRGISNLDIYISSEQTQDPTSPFTIDLQMAHDRRPDVVDLLNKNISMLLR